MSRRERGYVALENRCVKSFVKRLWLGHRVPYFSRESEARSARPADQPEAFLRLQEAVCGLVPIFGTTS